MMNELNILKRDGTKATYDGGRIVLAIAKAMEQTLGEVDMDVCNEIEEQIANMLFSEDEEMWTVEQISDEVENQLMSVGLYKVAKSYILYRNEKQSKRGNMSKKKYKFLTDEFLSKYKHGKDPFPTELGKFVYLRTYSRPIHAEKRREEYWETVARVVDYNVGLAPWKTQFQAQQEAEKLYDGIYNLKQFPSGRAMWSAGEKPSYLTPISQFNCSFAVFDNFDIIKDMCYLLMLGVGFGFSVEKQYVDLLPAVRGDIQVVHKSYSGVDKKNRKEASEYTITGDIMEIIVGDSKVGWSSALDLFIRAFYQIDFAHVNAVIMNYDNVRPFNEPLKTFGGFASGHVALQNMIEKIEAVLLKDNTTKKKLKPVECLDISTIIAEGIVVGGTRRSAECALISQDDKETQEAKMNLYKQDANGNWTVDENIVHRMMSNNSTAYWSKPTYEELKERFKVIKQSGENNFFNMESASKRKPNVKGTNPCGEILLDTNSFCNLVTLNCMAFVEDGKLDKEAMLEAQRLNARLSYRVTLPTLELPKWDAMQKRDRLLGLSMTGWMDMVNATNLSIADQRMLLRELKEVAIQSANSYADGLGLNRSELITCVKPEGTLSLLPTVSSGLHANHSEYYIRRIRINAQDPLLKTCEELGYPIFPEVGQDQESCKTKVIEFPVKAPQGKTKYDVSAIEQLETYKMFMEEYVQMNASNTISVRNDKEWEEAVEWVWENWDTVVGITFISLDDSFYQLLPYESCTKEEYESRKQSIKPITTSVLNKHERFDVSDELVDDSCASGACAVR